MKIEYTAGPGRDASELATGDVFKTVPVEDCSAVWMKIVNYDDDNSDDVIAVDLNDGITGRMNGSRKVIRVKAKVVLEGIG